MISYLPEDIPFPGLSSNNRGRAALTFEKDKKMLNWVKNAFRVVGRGIVTTATKIKHYGGKIVSFGGGIGRGLVRVFGQPRWPRRPLKEWWGKFYFPDIYFGPISWNLGFRPFVSALAGLLAAAVIKLVFWIPYLIGWFASDPINYRVVIVSAFLVFLWAVWSEEDESGNPVAETVPPTDYGAVVTFLGTLLPVIRKSGQYSWVGKRLGLDRSRKPFTGIRDPNVDAEEKSPLDYGFVPLGDATFQIWDAADSKTEADRTRLIRPAKNRAPFSGSLTLVGDFPKPRLWLRAIDSALDIGDRARQEYQEIADTINDTDISALQAKMQGYLFGKPLMTAFISKRVGLHKAGAMIRDKSGLVICDFLTDLDPDPTVNLEANLDRFRQKLTVMADPEMLREITDKGKNPPFVTVLQVSDPLYEVTEERGMNVHRVTFGDVKLSQKVSDAGEQASAESDEMAAQIASAKANREARKLLRPTPSELANPQLYELTTTLAAAADDKNGNIRVVMVPGGNQLAKAVVAAGQQIGDKR